MDLKRKVPSDQLEEALRTKVQRLDERLDERPTENDFAELRALMKLEPEEIGRTHADFGTYFDRLSHLLLNCVTLVVNSAQQFRLVEVEFYLRGGAHQDVFAHTNNEQLSCGEWSFHKQNETFRGGSYKGLDITFGAAGACHGGILIRGIQPSNQQSSKVVEGPCKVVEKILEQAECEKIADLVKHPSYSPSVFSENSILRLVPIRPECPRQIYKGPRVGLNLRDLDPERIAFMMKDYRYLIIPEQMTKGKPYIILSLYRQGKDIKEITAITQAKSSAVKNYVELYEKNTFPVEHFLGVELSISDICQVYSAIANGK